MIIPSAKIEQELKGKSLSTLQRENEDWYKKIYLTRKDKDNLIERNRMPHMQTGRIYTFRYDPKYAEELDFYDNNPISLIIHHVDSADKKGWNALGVNFSYIPPKLRIKMLDKLYKVFYDKGIKKNEEQIFKGKSAASQTSRININYEICKKILKDSGFEFAIRSYIYTRIETPPLIISYQDWYRVGTFGSRFIKKVSARAIYYRMLKSADKTYKPGKTYKEAVPKLFDI